MKLVEDLRGLLPVSFEAPFRIDFLRAVGEVLEVDDMVGKVYLGSMKEGCF